MYSTNILSLTGQKYKNNFYDGKRYRVLKILPFRQKPAAMTFRRSKTCGYENKALQAKNHKRLAKIPLK
jgi:hypothetical protein